MSVLGIVSVVGVVAAVVLAVVLMRMHRRDLVGSMLEKRRASSRLQSRAWYVEGTEEIDVALSLTNDTFYYENPDLEASFDLDRIDEIEYADDLATGHAVRHGCRVLRLRSHGAAFEFLLEGPDASKWMAALPARSYGNAPAASNVAAAQAV
jgi:hypothetical protein